MSIAIASSIILCTYKCEIVLAKLFHQAMCVAAEHLVEFVLAVHL